MDNQKLKGKKLFILDDEKAICMLIHGILDDLDFDISDANSLKEAEKILEDKNFDLIILDYNVGDGIGWSILEKISRNHEKYGKPAFLLISGTVGTDVLLKYIDNIKAEFLPKPFGIEKLKDKVISLLKSGNLSDSINH